MNDINTRLTRLLKLLGAEKPPASHVEKLVSAAGAFMGILSVYLISQHFLDSSSVFLVASMGASAVLLFAVPHGALSQPGSPGLARRRLKTWQEHKYHTPSTPTGPVAAPPLALGIDRSRSTSEETPACCYSPFLIRHSPAIALHASRDTLHPAPDIGTIRNPKSAILSFPALPTGR